MGGGGPAVPGTGRPDEWRNWSGELRFRPGALVRPDSENGVRHEVRRAAAAGVVLRPVGAGHSIAPLVRTDDVLLSLDGLPRGVLAADPDAGEATIGAGTRLYDLHDDLRAHGLAMENVGDVDTQAIAGVVSTATHGSGRGLPSLSAQLLGVRMVTADGEVVNIDGAQQPDLMRAVRVALGTLGIFTAVRLRVLPAFRVHRREWGLPIDECLASFDSLLSTNRNVDFYWYPRRDDAHLRTVNPVDHDPGPAALPHTPCTEEEVGWSGPVLTKQRTLRFNEMEYSLPAESGMASFQEVRERVKRRHRQHLGWRVLYRYVAATTRTSVLPTGARPSRSPYTRTTPCPTAISLPTSNRSSAPTMADRTGPRSTIYRVDLSSTFTRRPTGSWRYVSGSTHAACSSTTTCAPCSACDRTRHARFIRTRHATIQKEQ